MRINITLVGLIAMIIILGISLYSTMNTKEYSSQDNSSTSKVNTLKQEDEPINYNDDIDYSDNNDLNQNSEKEEVDEEGLDSIEGINDEMLIDEENTNHDTTSNPEELNYEITSKTEDINDNSSIEVNAKVNEIENECKEVTSSEISNETVQNNKAAYEKFEKCIKVKYVDSNYLNKGKSKLNATKIEGVKPKLKIDRKQYLLNLPCVYYKVQSGETLSDIARRYESKCNLNTTIKIISTINNFQTSNELEDNMVIKIPESTIKNGTMYKVVPGDTWIKVAQKYYPNYDVDSVMDFIVYINNFPNNDLPLGEIVFFT